MNYHARKICILKYLLVVFGRSFARTRMITAPGSNSQHEGVEWCRMPG